MRVGILAINGALNKPSSAIRGTEEARLVFYQDKNVYNDFEMIFGTESQINDYFKSLEVTPNDLSKETTVLFQGE